MKKNSVTETIIFTYEKEAVNFVHPEVCYFSSLEWNNRKVEVKVKVNNIILRYYSSPLSRIILLTILFGLIEFKNISIFL